MNTISVCECFRITYFTLPCDPARSNYTMTSTPLLLLDF
jgi:hypothetical protein